MKEIKYYDQIKDRIINGINSIADPVRSTLTPRGSNVIIQDDIGNTFVTNDGVTIAKNIEVEDHISQSVIDIIRHSALQTNNVSGDGTSTSVLLSQALILNGLGLISQDWNRMKLNRILDEAGKDIINTIDKMGSKVKTDKDILYIANVSANNDKEIAENVTKSIKIAGEDGVIMLDTNSKEETIIENEDGFMLEEGIFSNLLTTFRDKIGAQYKDIKVLITDKSIYSEKEALSIMEELLKNGYREAVIVAKDFVGNAPNVFITNHQNKKFNILLIKDSTATDKNTDTLQDLAAYIGTKVVSVKKGQLTYNVNIKDFGTVKRVICDTQKTLFISDNNSSRAWWLKTLKANLKDNTDDKKLKNRISRMTSGTVNIKVGAPTQIELKEKLFRYEDAISAVRIAQKEGYVEGGGTTLYKAFNKTNLSKYNKDVVDLLSKVCKTPLKQIAINCGIKLDELIENVNKGRGYNAVTEKFENLKKAGIIEPTSVVKLSFKNALSVARIILSSKYFITNYETKETNKGTDSTTK